MPGKQQDYLKLNLTRYIMLYLFANAKRFGYKIGIQFNKTPLFTDKKNYVTKILNAYIAYH